MKHRKKEKGFTLVELIVVIAIIAILSSVAIVGYTQFINNAKSSNAYNEFNQVYNVIYTDAAAVGLDGSAWHVSTDGANITVTFDEVVNNDGDKAQALIELLSRYLDAGFYQGEFIFEYNLLTYYRPGGGTASRAATIDIDENIKIKITVNKNGTLSSEIIVIE